MSPRVLHQLSWGIPATPQDGDRRTVQMSSARVPRDTQNASRGRCYVFKGKLADVDFSMHFFL